MRRTCIPVLLAAVLVSPACSGSPRPGGGGTTLLGGPARTVAPPDHPNAVTTSARALDFRKVRLSHDGYGFQVRCEEAPVSDLPTFYIAQDLRDLSHAASFTRVGDQPPLYVFQYGETVDEHFKIFGLNPPDLAGEPVRCRLLVLTVGPRSLTTAPSAREPEVLGEGDPDGQGYRSLGKIVAGGVAHRVDGGKDASAYVYQTALQPGTSLRPNADGTFDAQTGAATDTFIVALDVFRNILANDDDSGVASASRIAGIADVAEIVVATLDPEAEGVTALYVNDVSTDIDGDGLGHALETELGTTDEPPPAVNPSVACRTLPDHFSNSRDTDLDGLDDDLEVLGREVTQGGITGVLPLSKWGADPRHKDIFVEIDYRDDVGENPVYEWDAEKVQEFFAAGPAMHLGNPDGIDGVSVHFDVDGLWPTRPGNITLLGSWGGANEILESDLSAAAAARNLGDWMLMDDVHFGHERKGVFYHGLAGVGCGGQATAHRQWNFAWDVRGAACGGHDPANPTGRPHTLAHELGHSLYLKHPGWAGGVGMCAPTYASILSYEVLYDARLREVGFSDAVPFSIDALNPADLCEEEGLGITDGAFWDSYARPYLDKMGLHPPAQPGPVDWNRDGVIQDCATPIRAPISWVPSANHCHGHGQKPQDLFAPASGRTVLGAPAMVRKGGYLYVFYVVEPAHVVFVRRALVGAKEDAGCDPAAGCGGPCMAWGPEEQVALGPGERASNVAVHLHGDEVLLAYRSTDDDSVHLTATSTQDGSGALGPWSPPAPLAGAHALGDLEFGDIGWATALFWADKGNGSVLLSTRDHVQSTFPASTFAAPEFALDANGSPILTYAANSAAVASWGTANTLAPGTPHRSDSQTWMVVSGRDHRLRMYRYLGRASGRWDDATSRVAATPPGAVVFNQKVAFAFKPLLRADGTPLEALKGVFMLLYREYPEAFGTVWVSEVVDAANPPVPPSNGAEDGLRFVVPDQAGRFATSDFGFRHGPVLGRDSGFDLYADAAMPSVKAVVVRADGKLQFLPYPDGIRDMDFAVGSDFRIMRWGICTGLKRPLGRTCECGPTPVPDPLGCGPASQCMCGIEAVVPARGF